MDFNLFPYLLLKLRIRLCIIESLTFTFYAYFFFSFLTQQLSWVKNYKEKKEETGKTVRLSKNKWALCRVAATVVNAKTVAPEKQFGKKKVYATFQILLIT